MLHLHDPRYQCTEIMIFQRHHTNTRARVLLVCDASNQPTSGSERHQSAVDSVSRSMKAHIRDSRRHPPCAICSAFHLKVPLPSIRSPAAHLGTLLDLQCDCVVAL
ncbi:hypothetical protein PBY51_013930 [Eleginops maclovinus]|uniref:Uncharacterized protein n=1 Tax=Eleginops maclovinus TaxID=56733 RepID=A0AAN7WWE0_ELEMC|nr:hypothetical protein PBY51_013930 [Eleginops maclovinus]